MPGDSYNPFDTTIPLKPEIFGHAAYAERKLPDGLLGSWERGALPEDANVTQVLLAPYRGERPVLAFKDGRLWLPEGEVAAGETADAAIRRVAMEQVGVSELRYRELGHLRCVATRLSTSQPEGNVTYRAFYAVEVQELADFPADQRYERRISIQRDINDLIRSHYVELRREYMEVLDLFVLELHKAAAAARA
ncbi:MAG: NUDIX domain-containing protein [Dehalococcoidia bacterium]